MRSDARKKLTEQAAVATPDPDAERITLTEDERETLDNRIAGDWWGYYIHFEPTGLPEVDRLLSAVGLAGKMYHNTDMWNEDDANYGPIREGESPVDFIQRAANDAADRLRVSAERETRLREAVERLIADWERYGPGTEIDRVMGEQMVTVEFAVGQLRRALYQSNDKGADRD